MCHFARQTCPRRLHSHLDKLVKLDFAGVVVVNLSDHRLNLVHPHLHPQHVKQLLHLLHVEAAALVLVHHVKNLTQLLQLALTQSLPATHGKKKGGQVSKRIPSTGSATLSEDRSPPRACSQGHIIGCSAGYQKQLLCPRSSLLIGQVLKLVLHSHSKMACTDMRSALLHKTHAAVQVAWAA
eukprot:351771-Chlamydomonas_euryale.AAC.5